ncbi:MAG: response regulator [Smithella sp.]
MTEQKQIHILCMEDDPGLAMIFKKKLRRAGFKVDIAQDGKEGLTMVESQSYDIVAVDYIMPYYSGLDVIRILSARENPPPMIMITGMGSEEIAVEAMKMGAADYVVKDSDGHYLDLLLSVIENILQKWQLVKERNLAREALRESEEKYNQFFKTSRDCIFITEDGSLIDINDAAVELLGYSSREELLQVKVPDLYAETEEWTKYSSTILKFGYCKNYPVDLRRKDGDIRHTLITSAARYDKNGNPIGLQGTIRDVTEQRRNEEELKKYRENLEIMVAERTSELEEKTKNLQEVNMTLNVLLKKREEDKKNLEENFVANIGSIVLPYLEKMRKNNLDAQQQFCLDTVEKNLDEIASPLLKNIQQFNLTPREVQIACLIKDGKTTKEIASVLGIAEGSISTHRKNLRKKLGLDRDSNLQSHLRYFEK